MKIRIIYVLLAVILGLAASYYLGNRKASLDTDRLSTALISSRDTIRIYTKKIQGLEQTVFETSTIVLDQKQAIAAGLLDRERLRKLSVERLRTNTKLTGEIRVLKDSLKIKNPEIIYIDTTGTDPTPYMKLPAEVNFNDDFIDLKVNLYADESWGFDLGIKLDLEVTVGQSVVITTPNPYVSINEIQSVYVPEELKWHQRPLIRGLVIGGVAAGVVLLVK